MPSPQVVRTVCTGVQTLTRIADPVLVNLSQGTLKKNMPFESLSDEPLRRSVSYLEAVGRTVCGIAPWLELGPDDTQEGKLRERVYSTGG